MHMRLNYCALLILSTYSLLASFVVHGKEQIVVYSRNYDNAFLHKSISNFAALNKEEFGEYELVKSPDMEQGRAFAELIKGNIDIMVSAPTEKREQQANAIYVPIDRGLLGFRICMVNASKAKFSAIQSANQFIQRSLSVGLGSHWSDREVFEDNGFKVITSPVHESLFRMLENNRFDCLPRSINEIDAELEQHANKGLIDDQEIVFIYPNADFIFINPDKKKLHNRISTGVGKAIEDNTFYEIFDEYYENELRNHNIYSRKLVFLENDNMTPAALSAINRFGIASFVFNPIRPRADSSKSSRRSDSD